jgi:hypothetical protein
LARLLQIYNQHVDQSLQVHLLGLSIIQSLVSLARQNAPHIKMSTDALDDIFPETSREIDDMKRPSFRGPVHLENIRSSATEHQIPDDTVWENGSPQNPRNWSNSKKNAQILMVAFHSMMGTFMAAGIIPAYDTFAEAYGVTVPDASYLTSFQVCVMLDH